MRRGLNRLKLNDRKIGFIIIVVFIILFFWEGVNGVTTTWIPFDSAYNATVAANLARHGEYRVSYPAEILFYRKITTGVPLIVPTAIVYKLFGISSITTASVSLIYGVLSILLINYLLFKCLPQKKKSVRLAALLTVLLVLINDFFRAISCMLIGEIGAVFFILISSALLLRHFETEKQIYAIEAGAFLAFAFLTKNIVIFLIVTFCGLMIFEIVVMHSIHLKSFICYLLGFIVGFITMDSYKFIVLGGWDNYLKWWIEEWDELMSQSSGIDMTLSVSEKINTLDTIFIGCNKYFCVGMILLPIFIYGIRVIVNLKNRNWKISNEMLLMMFLGVGGSSMLVFYLLLGGRVLGFPRRMAINLICLYLFITYFVVGLICEILKLVKKEYSNRRKWILQTATMIFVASTIIIGAFPLGTLIKTTELYLEKSEKQYVVELMDVFLEEIDELEDDAVLFCSGWWQEPNVSLFLDRKLVDINSHVEVTGPAYFIVGYQYSGDDIARVEAKLNATLTRIDTSEIDRTRFKATTGNDLENFAIYKVNY